MSAKLKPILLADRECIEKKLQGFHNLSCEYSFTNLFNWGEIYDTRWVNIEGVLYFYYGLENTLLMPVPNPSPTLIADFPDMFNLPKENFYITHATEKYIADNPSITDFFVVEDDDRLFDYVHQTERLIELKGAKLTKKRNLISQFLRNNLSYECRKISPEIYEDCVSFAKKWSEIKVYEHISISHEQIAIKRAFEHFQQIGLEGLAIFANTALIAFSVFSRQNPETYIVHFEKADKTLKGSAQLINWETAKYLKGKCVFINREQDIAIPGLRQAKSSYDPDILLGGKTLKLN